MTDNDSEFATIRPSSVALSHKDDQTTPAEPSRAPSRGVIIAVVALLIVGVWVFFVLPSQVSSPVVERKSVPAPSSSDPAAPPSPAASVAGGAAPFQSVQEQRAREKAQASLSRFVELQITLEEEMNVEAWGAEAFNAAQSLANEGDELFSAQRFDEAIDKYDTGSTALEALVAAGETQFQTALAEGDAAIERRDASAAAAAYASAAAAAYASAAIIFPDHPRVTTGIARAERLPEVLRLWDSANRHQVRGEWDEALADFAAIKELDANTTGIDEAVAIVRAEIAERDFQSQVSRGYAALDAGRFDTALKAFNAALAMRPGDPAATDGRKQVLQGRTLARIERLRIRAAGLAEAEDWRGAEKAYGEVLAVDGSLKFARDGQQEAKSRAALNTELDNAIANPGDLSSDKAFADTVALFERAVGVQPAGPKLTAQLDRLESILAVAAEPVRLTLVSDNATQVKIYQVGNLGVFARKDVHVRPGRYVITGSRDGCRDVRKEVTVTPDMAPIDIRCQERI